MRKGKLLQCFSGSTGLAVAVLWAGTFAALSPPALAQSDAPQAETSADTESEPDLAGLVAAVEGMTMAEPLAGLSVGSADYPRYGIRIHVFDFEQTRFAMRVAEQKAPTGSRAGDFLEGNDDVFVINGGFFERDGSDRLSPSGLLIIDGKVVAEEHQRGGSGVIYAGSDGLAIVPRKAFRDRPGVSHALQVGPLLVDPGGAKGIYKNDVKRHNRSAICLRKTSFIAVVVEGGISLFQLADLLSRQREDGGFGCEVAINLDGGPSTQAVLRAGSVRLEIAGGTTVENAIVISRK